MDENRNITHEELSELLSERKDPARQIAILEAGLANANAEVERLREALTKIMQTAKSWEGRKEAPYWNLGDIASNALGTKED